MDTRVGMGIGIWVSIASEASGMVWWTEWKCRKGMERNGSSTGRVE